MAQKKPMEFRTTFSSYVAVKIIGEGGSGRVYSAKEDDGTQVAIKLLTADKATQERRKRFENEYRFSSLNKHPNVISVTDRGLSDDSAPFFVMPLYQGSLRGLLSTGVEPNVSLDLFSKIMDGVEAAHLFGVVHRDLKPENILVNDGGQDLVVADFGIAQFLTEDLYTAVETKAASRLANFQYAAPEQRTRGATTDQRTDIYSLGLILNEIFTGTVPQGTNFKTIGSIHESFSYLDSTVAAMLAQDPKDRPERIREIRQELNSQREVYLSNQKLSILKNTVIPENEIDDPLALHPPEVVDVDWNNQILTIRLDRPINPGWLEGFHNIGSHTAVLNKGPSAFSFSGSQATVQMSAQDVQNAVNFFKEWLPRAPNRYRQNMEQAQEQARRRESQEIERRIRDEEQRRQVLDNLEF